MKRSVMTAAMASAFLGLGLAASQAQAVVIPSCGDSTSSFGLGCSLQELVGGGSIQVTDKLFSNWQVITNLFTNTDGEANLSLIEVVGLDDDPDNPGLRLNSNGGAWALNSNEITAQYLGIFRFEAAVVGSAQLIADHSLSLIPGSITYPGAVAANLLSCPLVCSPSDILTTYSGLLDGSVRLFDEQDFLTGEFPFAPQSAIRADLTVRLVAAQDLSHGVGSAEISAIEIRYSQIPEPGTLALLGLGLAGLSASRRRKQ